MASWFNIKTKMAYQIEGNEKTVFKLIVYGSDLSQGAILQNISVIHYWCNCI